MDEFFSNIQVMTGWGAKRMYKITKVRLDLNPVKAKFKAGDDENSAVSLKDYFKEKYEVDLDPDQPLLEVGHR